MSGSGMITMLSDEAGFNEDPPELMGVYNESGFTISKGDWVAWDLATNTYGRGRSVAVAPAAAADSPLVFGVAHEDIPNNSAGAVVTKGVVNNVNVATGTAAGLLLQMSATAGRAEAAAAATERGIAVCLSLAADNQATVYIK